MSKEGETLQKEIIEFTTDYLQNKISRDRFVALCKKIYEQSLSSEESSIQLDSIIWLPFIHEFAYCKYTDLELKRQVTFLNELLSGKQQYHYSSWFKLSCPDSTNKTMYDLYLNFHDVELADLNYLFTELIENPVTLKDILHNLIYDILSKLNLSDLEESEFNYVNCCENVSYTNIKEKVLNFFAYYLGIDSFYVDVTVCSTRNTIYTIS